MTKKKVTKKSAVKPTDGHEPDNNSADGEDFRLTHPDLNEINRRARHAEAQTVSLQIDERLREALGKLRNEYSEMMPGVTFSNSDIVRAVIFKAAKD